MSITGTFFIAPSLNTAMLYIACQRSMESIVPPSHFSTFALSNPRVTKLKKRSGSRTGSDRSTGVEPNYFTLSIIDEYISINCCMFVFGRCSLAGFSAMAAQSWSQSLPPNSKSVKSLFLIFSS